MEIAAAWRRLRHAVRVIKRIRSLRASDTRIATQRSDQWNDFSRLADGFSDLYNKIALRENSDLTLPYWSRTNAELERYLLPKPRFDFLNQPLLIETLMTERDPAADLRFLEKHLSRERLQEVLREDLVGDPAIHNELYATSYLSVFHLRHMVEYELTTGARLADFQRVIEWGGGQGNFAKLMWRINGPRTYVVVDTPLFTCLQWLYLSTTLGAHSVVVHSSEPVRIRPGLINLVPLSLIRSATLEPPDLFVSTWALSESSRAAQDFAVARGWMAADHLLLAYQTEARRFPLAERVGGLAKSNGAEIIGVAGWPKNFYAFK